MAACSFKPNTNPQNFINADYHASFINDLNEEIQRNSKSPFVKNFKNNYLVFVFISFIVFIFVFYNCFLDLDYSDSVMYLNYASQNVNIDKLNLFNLYTGKYGMEWEDLCSN